MARRIIDLSALSWQFGRVPRAPFSARPADDRCLVSEWLPARIPGDVRGDLMAAGRIPPVESPEGIAAGAWVDDYDWWYRATLPGLTPADQADAVAVLEADGIDYYSAIWLDGRLLATHAGMFSRQAVTLSPDLAGLGQAPGQAPGSHELAIRVWGGGAVLGQPRPGWQRLLRAVLNIVEPNMDHLSERMALPKAQFSYGWDFAPRLLTAGIWDDARVVLARGAYIGDLWAYGEPLAEGDDPVPVRWHVHVRVDCRTASAIRAEVTIAPEDETGFTSMSPEPVEGRPGSACRTFEICPPGVAACAYQGELLIDMPAASRWWPWDQGEPNLYRVTVRLFDDQGQLDEISRLAGARTIRRDPLPGGAPWRFVVNDRPIFLRGANWVPADSLPGRVVPADYERLLGQARTAGFNFLRVWAGGVREKRAFWETCDRLGLLAWQEFPLACDFFDSYPADAAYLKALGHEAAGTIRALRGHPCLIAWCGGNEIDTAREAAPLQRLAAEVARYDPTRPWIPASPSDGDVHQWDVWHGRSNWACLADADLPLMSEFGLQALPVGETLAEMYPAGVPGSWRDPRWVARFAQVAKLRHYMGALSHELSPAAAVSLTQRVQAAALQTGVEACRLRRHTCGGVAIWQLNEPWPAVSWAIIDRAGRPKRAYQALARSCQPLLLAARFPRRQYRPGDRFQASIWLANDGPQAWRGGRVEVYLDGDFVWSRDGVEVSPASAAAVGEFVLALRAAPGTLALRLLHGAGEGEVLAANEYDLAVPSPGAQPLAARLYRRLGKLLVKTE